MEAARAVAQVVGSVEVTVVVPAVAMVVAWEVGLEGVQVVARAVD